MLALRCFLQDGLPLRTVRQHEGLFSQNFGPLTARGVPFVFATGYDDRTIPAAYKDVPRWEKPFEPHDLARSLPTLLQKS